MGNETEHMGNETENMGNIERNTMRIGVTVSIRWKGYSHKCSEVGIINNDIWLDWHNLPSSIPYLVSHKNM